VATAERENFQPEGWKSSKAKLIIFLKLEQPFYNNYQQPIGIGFIWYSTFEQPVF
jgi:hypothetical protein